MRASHLKCISTKRRTYSNGAKKNVAELWKIKYLSLPAAYFSLISRSRFVLFIFQRSTSPCSKDGEDGVDLCSGCSPLWSPLSWPLPSRWENHTGWQGWPAAGWLVAWSWWCRWPPAQPGPGGRYGQRKKRSESRQERKGRKRAAGVKVEIEGEKSHWRVSTPTIGTEQKFEFSSLIWTKHTLNFSLLIKWLGWMFWKLEIKL